MEFYFRCLLTRIVNLSELCICENIVCTLFLKIRPIYHNVFQSLWVVEDLVGS